MKVEIHWYNYVKINSHFIYSKPYLVRKVLDMLFVDRQNDISLSQQATF